MQVFIIYLRVEMLLQKFEHEHDISRRTPSCQAAEAYKETKEVMKSNLRIEQTED